MPTTYTDQSYAIDTFPIENGNSSNGISTGDTVPVTSLTIVDVDDDGEIGVGDTVNGFTINTIYIGDTVTVDGNVISGATFDTSGGFFFTPTDGTILTSGTLNDASSSIDQGNIPVSDLGPPCFVKGTVIETSSGGKAIEDLKVGDFVLTKDGGAQEIRWIGSRVVRVGELMVNPKLRPVVIPVADGPDLRVSRQHRMLISGDVARRMFGVAEILLAAKDLIGFRGTHLDQSTAQVHYFHILLDTHHVVSANGLAAETLYLGREGVKAMTKAAREELAQIFPDLLHPEQFTPQPLCREVHKGKRVRKLVERSEKNGKELVAAF